MGQFLNEISNSAFPLCNTNNIDAITNIDTTESYNETKTDTTMPTTTSFQFMTDETTATTEESQTVSPSSTNTTYVQASEKNLLKRTLSTTASSQISQQHLPTWSIILIISLLLVILVTTTIIAFLCVRRAESKVEHSQSRMEHQLRNASVLSFETEKC